MLQKEFVVRKHPNNKTYIDMNEEFIHVNQKGVQGRY